MLFVGTSIIHPSTEGVFLLCNILDLLIYSTKTELLLSLTTSSTSKSTFDSSNMSAIPKIGKQLISFILTNYNKILPFCSTIQDSLLIDLVIFLLIENFL